MFDILKKNISISRTINETYVEDNETKVLQQYFLFTLTYTFKNFKNGLGPEEMKVPKNMPPPDFMPFHPK